MQWQSQREKDFAKLEQAKQKMPKTSLKEVEKDIEQAIKEIRKKSAQDCTKYKPL